MISVPLSRELQTWIDDADEVLVAQFRWCAAGRQPHVYAVTNRPMVGGVRGGQILLHRLIADPPSDLVVDHRNGNTLDNRRHNLRVCTHQQNIAAGRSRTGCSMYKGVTFDKDRVKWKAQIKVSGKHMNLGRFDTEAEAAQAYNRAASAAWGDFASLNITREEALAY